MILFFDTETTGVPQNHDAPASDVNNWPRLVQLAFIKTDWEGNIIDSKDFIIKPQGFTIPKESTKFHGISNEYAIQSGSNLREVLELFNNEIERASIIVAHNIKFDKKIIAAEFFRNNITSSILNRTNICTMERSTNFCALSGNKWPKLSELHKKLFNEEFQEQHNAKHDILATYKCFWELNRREIIKVSKPKLKINNNLVDTNIKANVGNENELNVDDNILIPYRWGLKMGLCTPDKKIVLDRIYDFIYPFSEGLAMVQLNCKIGFIDKINKLIVPCIYDSADNFSEGLAGIKLNGKWGFINKEGKKVIHNIYDTALPFSEGLAAVEINGKWGYIDKSGQEKIPCIYDDANSFSEGLAPVGLNNKHDLCKYMFIDKAGKKLHSICPSYDFAYPFSEGLAAIQYSAGKFGFIDKTIIWETVIPIPCIYDDAIAFSEGLALVAIFGGYGFIDKAGKCAIPFIYEDAYVFSEGLAAVKYDGKWGYIDKTGKEIISYIYDEAGDFKNGIALVKLHEYLHCCIDKNGTEYWEYD